MPPGYEYLSPDTCDGEFELMFACYLYLFGYRPAGGFVDWVTVVVIDLVVMLGLSLIVWETISFVVRMVKKFGKDRPQMMRMIRFELWLLEHKRTKWLGHKIRGYNIQMCIKGIRDTRLPILPLTWWEDMRHLRDCLEAERTDRVERMKRHERHN